MTTTFVSRMLRFTRLRWWLGLNTEEVVTTDGRQVVNIRRYRTNPVTTVKPWSSTEGE
jgi:hypothetical protein